MPDTGFFEVMRHYLGPLQTPFHKPELISRMDSMFRRDDVGERVRLFIDPEDARLLTIIDSSNGITGGAITGMTPQLSGLELRTRLLNLEERLLVWSRPSGRVRVYELTPLGQQMAAEGVTGPGAVLGPGQDGEIPRSRLWLDDNFLTFSLAMLSENPLLFRKEGGWRKKALENMKAYLPVLFADHRGEERLLLAGRGLIASGLAERKGERLVPDIALWRQFEALEAKDRISRIRARAAVGRAVPPEDALKALNLFTDHLPPGRFYSTEALASLFQLAAGRARLSPAGARRVISHFELMGILASGPDGLLGAPERNPAGTGPGQLTLTPVGDLTLSPDSTLFCDLALSTRPGKLDVLGTFTMDKNRFQNGLESGVSTSTLLQEMENRSGRPVPDNIRTLCDEWETDHRELNLQIAVVLRARGLRQEILENTGVLQPFALDNPAPGIWILNPDEQAQWEEALRTVGVERLPIISDPGGCLSDGPTASVNSAQVREIPWIPDPGMHPLAQGSWAAPEEHDCQDVLSALRSAAAKAGLSPEEMRAFEERLNRRVILVEDQIRPGAWRYEVMTAKGLDYRGKIRLAEAALAGRDERLELSVAVGNDIETITLLPESIEKDGDEHILVGLSYPGEEIERYRIRKIGLLRRIRTSLF